MKYCLLICLMLMNPTMAKELQIKASNKNLRYIGRFTPDHEFAWTGSSIELEFEGEGVIAQFSYLGKKPSVAMTAILDGEEKVLFIKKGMNDYPVASGLSKGRHKLLLFRRSEASFGVLQFNGLKITDAGKLFKVVEPKRKIHVIGDSITCGYGNGTTDLKEGNTVENENGYMSYAAIAARSLKADIMMTSWSGRGMSRNGKGSYDALNTLPGIYDYILPENKEGSYGHKEYVPDVFVINLGTNDMRKGREALSKDKFINAYTQFIEKLRAYAPKAKIVLSIGPMGTKPVSAWLPEIAKQFKDVEVLIFDAYKKQDEKGGHFHPTVKKDQLMAAQLVKKIQVLCKWK